MPVSSRKSYFELTHILFWSSFYGNMCKIWALNFLKDTMVTFIVWVKNLLLPSGIFTIFNIAAIWLFAWYSRQLREGKTKVQIWEFIDWNEGEWGNIESWSI